MMVSAEKLRVQWNYFKENITSSFKELRMDREFTDVTLAFEDGEQMEAHRVILVSSSPFFKDLLKKNKHPHPLVYMRGLKSENLVALVDFLYQGEANVFQENLDSLLVLAEELKLKGLTEGEREQVKESSHSKEVPLKKENSPSFLANSNFDCQSSKGSLDTADAVTEDKLSVDLQDLDQQIRSMITKMLMYIC